MEVEMSSKDCITVFVLIIFSLFTSSCKEEQPNEPKGGNESCPGIPTVTYEGKVYNTIQIGNQCWLKENLDVGKRIDGNDDQTDNGIKEKYCYDNDTANCNTYGGLYQWDEAMQYSSSDDTQGICPIGWHIPTLEEFNTLVNALSSSANALKNIGQGTGTNTSGFSALLAGYRKREGSFSYLNGGTGFWISSESSDSCAWVLELHSDRDDVVFDCYYKDIGFYIRCIKD